MIEFYSTRPIEEVNKSRFKQILAGKEICVSRHATDHLSKAQRNVFKHEELINMLVKEKPRKIYLQKNGRYTPYYRKSNGYRKLILEVEVKKIVVVSFMDPHEVPKIRL